MMLVAAAKQNCSNIAKTVEAYTVSRSKMMHYPIFA